ncbi:hypothetical protein M422DRAFT_251957 [Sphaerobolus stellatus SS14]|uniref:Uncharacterized protein n=1 Tax=Sphaerobolus stellatus (strain SS14) TaxID=990650 RepID=A0A0C9VCG8_SPHS4|nr:hypothetical protein M422DRAFT_251957 [Sphaerobolus stellatus SS14]
MSQASSSNNAADLLLCFHNQQAKHEGPHVEVGAVPGACFIYHPTGCDQCSAYVEHLLADMEHCLSKFSFSRDETLGRLQEAWPKLGQYITDIGDERDAAEKELADEKLNNYRLEEEIKALETQITSLQTNSQVGDQSITVTSPTNTYSSEVGPHPLASPETRTYSYYWSLHLWNSLKDWHTNPMSIPNAIRDDSDGYFLEEDVDIVAWISKVSLDISHPSFMHQMKVSCLSVHAPMPAKTGESNEQQLDTDLDSYHQVREPILPYEEEPPSGVPDVKMHVPVLAGTSGTLPNESTMNVD